MRVLLAKTALDGHWRGVNAVARALRDAGFEVLFVGMARAEQIAASAVDEDVDLVGLNVGGRVEVVERIVDAIRERRPDMPIMAGGTIPPWAARRLQGRGLHVYPPDTALSDIAAEARELASGGSPGEGPAGRPR